MVKFKLRPGQIIKSLLKAVIILFIAFFSISACQAVTQRETTNIVGTRWLSQNDAIAFVDESMGLHYVSQTEIISFSYEYSKGYIFCLIDEEIILELAHLKEDRLFAINTNVMYYNEAVLLS